MPLISQVFHSAHWRRAAAGSGWLLADRFIRMGLGFGVAVALARLLGPSSYGTLIYATTLATIFLPLASLGLERIVVRELARSVGERPGIIGAAAGLRLAGGLVSFLLAVAAGAVLGGGEANLRWMVAAIAAGNVFLAADVVDWAFQADGLFRLPVLTRLTAFVVGALAKIALAAAGAPLLWLAGAVWGEMALTGLLLVAVARRLPDAPPRVWTFRREAGARLLAASWPLLFAEVAIWIFQRLDLVILNRFGNEAEVGRYAVALRIAQVGFFLPTVAAQVLSPKLARGAREGRALAQAEKAMAGLVAMGLSLAVFLAVAAPWFVPLLFGRKYVASAHLLMVLGWTNVFVFMGCCHGLYLVAIDQQRISLRLTWITAVCSLVLNLGLIPHWQAMGAAVASLATLGLTSLFGVALFPESRPLFRMNGRALLAPFALLYPGWHRHRRPGPS